MSDHQFEKYLSSPLPGDEVVVAGISGRYPESRNIQEFADNLFARKDLATDDTRRWDIDHPHLPKKSSKIHDSDRLDGGFFGVHYRQADVMDPMMRKQLETAIEAVMDAGVNPSDLEGSRTGVFVGGCFADLEAKTLISIREPQTLAVTGYLRCFLPHRISYYLKLKGPSVVVDTACSSSLNALELAFRKIRTGQCDNAIVSGVNMPLHPGITIQFFRLGVLCMDGICKVFDQNADGYVRSEAVVTVFLQKAKDAKRIYEQLLYSRVNCDGFKSQGITYPSTKMQQQLITESLVHSGVSASDFSYMEAHGTGTEVGDPEEVEAIDNAVGKHRDKPLLIGSVKCNMGHAEPASGLCSISKIVIATETGRIPPNIQLNKIKDTLYGVHEGRLKIVTEETDLPTEGGTSVVGVNNFGFGGNNCHLIMRSFGKIKTDGGVPKDDIPRLVCVCGRTKDAVLTLLNNANETFDYEYYGLLHDLFKRDIKNHLYRGYTVVSKTGPVRTSLKLFDYQPHPLYVFFGKYENRYKTLGKYMMQFPVFKDTMARINVHLLDKNIDDILNDKRNHHLGTVAVQIGIVDMLKAVDLHPVAVYGDSIGKLATAYYYQVITLKDAVLAARKHKSTFKKHFDLDLEEIISDLKPTTINGDDGYFSSKIKTWQDIEDGGDKFLTQNGLKSIPKIATVLNVSEEDRLSKVDVSLVENEDVKLLEVLGTLYERGHTLQLHKLYSPVEYPVSRRTPMISPLIKWNYDRSWYMYRFCNFELFHGEERNHELNYLYDKYIAGHVIDGRNLIPATEYLKMVWKTFALERKLRIEDIAVVFENCKFIKAVTLPNSRFIKLVVFIQKGSGIFEVVEGSSVVVTGRIYALGDGAQHKIDLPPPAVLDEADPTLVLKQDEIYRELYLRGYNYSGIFKGIIKCNVEASTGLVQWEDNWTTFVDKMLQMKILQIDSRSLYVPIGIMKLIIDPFEHLRLAKEHEGAVFPVHVYKECNLIKSGGIQISGLQAKSISKRKSLLLPVLEKHVFVPNRGHFDLATSVRIDVQIILENTLDYNFKAVEVTDDPVSNDSDFLLPLVSQVLEDVPLIRSDLTISTKTVLDKISGVKVEHFFLTATSNLTLIVGNNLLRRSSLKSLLNALCPNGFALSREDVENASDDNKDVNIVTEFATPSGKLVLFQKAKEQQSTKVVKVSSFDFNWLPELQRALKDYPNVIVYSRNDEFAGIMGMVNCIRQEPGGSKVKCFFMMDEAPEFNLQNPFYQNQIRKNLALNVYKNSEWGTYRHLLLESLEDVECEHVRVNTLVKGDLSSLRWVEGFLTYNTPLNENFVMVQCYYSSINFKDVMIASGRINVDVFTTNRLEQDYWLGMEYSGRDMSGRKVAGMSTNSSLSTLYVADAASLFYLPDDWSLQDAATVPVIYSTVLYAFFKITTLKPGSSILIHSATGGIGMAALNVCLYYGCEIFVTVGTQEKRNYLKENYPQIPDSHMGNSHDTSFEEMIKKETRGRGVDFVLNSLTEDKLMASVRSLARGGQFLEIGKYDLVSDVALKMLMLEKEISYHGVMLDQFKSRDIKIWIVNKFNEGVKLGYVKPLPKTVFQKDEVDKAFRYMTTGQHMGKVLIKIKEEEEDKIVKPTITRSRGFPRFNCDPERCYIIVGGLGGFGLELADWLILRGARNVVLVSSSGVKTGYQTQRLRIWKSYGVNVHISKCDVRTKEGCVQLIEESTKLGLVDGVFNLAVVLKDALFEDQTEENFHISLAPKAYATQNLDQVTRELCPKLRYFVIFSSVSCGRGNAGQTNYGMANSVMERICEKRKSDGYPALAIQWGAIGDVGLVAKMQKENKELVIGGTLQQRVSSCLEVLDKFLRQDNPIVSSMVVAEKKKNYDAESAVEAVAAILGIKDLKTVSEHVSLAELGMDSMTGNEVMQTLEKDFEIYITTKDIRSLTFARLRELEADKKNVDDVKDLKKTQQGVNMLLQHIPDNKTNETTLTRLPSLVDEAEEGAIVFVFCGIEGTFKPLLPLVHELHAHVFGIQYSYNKPEDTIEEIAATVAPLLAEKVSSDKIFHIVGYSFGVLVSLEVTALLEKRGYIVNVIAIEGSPKYILGAVEKNLPTKSDAEFQTSLILRLMSIVLPTDLLAQSEDQFLKCKDFDDRIDLALKLIPADAPKKANLNFEKQGAVVLYKHFKAILNYAFVHDKIKSRVHFFRAKYPIADGLEDDHEWSEICEQPVEVVTIDGDHVTILNQNQLFTAIKELLN